jgi:hypothetical protein
MSILVRRTTGIILVIGLSCIVGCASAQSGNKQGTTNIFRWQKAEKEPEKQKPMSVEDFIGKDRVTTLRR